MRLSELVYDVKNILYKGPTSDDSNLSDYLVEHWINQWRAESLKKAKATESAWLEPFVQRIPCVDLECAPLSECITVAGIKQKNLSRSVKKLPDVLNLGSMPAVWYVGLVDGMSPFHFGTFSEALYSSGMRATGTKPKAYLRDGRLYIKNAGVLRTASLEAVFENPRQVRNFLGDYGFDYDYPMSFEMWKEIKASILRSDLWLMFSFAKSEVKNLVDETLSIPIQDEKGQNNQ
ncbi:MAG: hypothetical protein RMM53_10470 [Bacteroidia bacterium]|nr:hypothetical protein [Bacteroidia bacterium]